MKRAAFVLVALFFCIAAAGLLYSIKTGGVDSGGGRASGSAYAVEASIGGAVHPPSGASSAGNNYRLEVVGIQLVPAGESPRPSGGGGGCAPR